MTGSQELPVTGVPALWAAVIGAIALGLGTLLIAASRWGAKLRG